MRKIGLKLWSTNLNYLRAAKDLFIGKVFDYIELFVVPGSLETLPRWKSLGIPYTLHAPHSASGLNPADQSLRISNLDLVQQIDAFFQTLQPSAVIFHPGINGNPEEAISQFREMRQHFPEMFDKVVLENKPGVGLKDEKCLGASPEEIGYLIRGTGFGFCLDFAHMICYSVSAGMDWRNVAGEFLTLSPSICHVCDGFYTEKDAHEHLGYGNFDMAAIFELLPSNVLVTIETPKDFDAHLLDFAKDVDFMNSYVLRGAKAEAQR